MFRVEFIGGPADGRFVWLSEPPEEFGSFVRGGCLYSFNPEVGFEFVRPFPYARKP